MSLQTLALATGVVIFGAIQYTLAIQALKDLVHRPRVRGGNKMSWALLILCLPIAGAFLYSWMGPTSFLGHRIPTQPERAGDSMVRYTSEHGSPRPRNVTPLYPRPSSTVRGRTSARRPGLTRSRAHNTSGRVSHMRRTGS